MTNVIDPLAAAKPVQNPHACPTARRRTKSRDGERGPGHETGPTPRPFPPGTQATPTPGKKDEKQHV